MTVLLRALCRGRNFVVLTALATTTWSLPTLAQRGQSPNSSIEPISHPFSSYPGYFDPYMVEPRKFVMELPPITISPNGGPVPSLAADFGVSKTLTIGTSGIGTLLPFVLGGAGATAKIRTLVYGSPDFQSAVTVYAGYMMFLQADTRLAIDYTVFTSNNAWVLNPKSIVLSNVTLARYGLTAGSPDDLGYASINAMTAALGGGYSRILSDKVAITGLALLPVYEAIEADTSTVSLNANTKTLNAEGTAKMARVHVDIKPAKKWVFNVGLLYMPALTVVETVAPWVGGAIKF